MKKLGLCNVLMILLIGSSYGQNLPSVVTPTPNYSGYALALEAIFGMGIRLQALLEEQEPGRMDKNFVVSPISATAIIGQLMLGAEGEFRDQLYQLLSLPKSGSSTSYTVVDYNKNKQNESYVLPYANFHLQLSSLLKTLGRSRDKEEFTLREKSALFYAKEIHLKKRFEKNMRKFYGVDLFSINFATESAKLINSWASKHTNGLINSVLASPPGPETSSIFLNAIYFLAEWKCPFSDELNKIDRFFVKENKIVQTTYMRGALEQIMYGQGADYSFVSLPYKNDELGMYILLPNKDNVDKYNIQKFAEKMQPKEVLETLASGRLHDVTMKIPKLSLSNSLSILKPLQKYKVYRKQSSQNHASNTTDSVAKLEENVHDFNDFTTPIQETIYLSGAAENANLKVSDIVQHMIFSINEKGTEAAAVSLGTIDYSGGYKNFVLDRPFVFLIRHQATSAVVFWGTISDPSSN